MSLTEGHEAFAARLQRIETQSRARQQRIFVGDGESFLAPIREKGKRRPKRPLGLGRKLAMVSAFLSGLIGHALGMVLQAHINPGPWLPTAAGELLAEAVLGLVISLMLGAVVGLAFRHQPGMRLLGCLLSLLWLPHLVAAEPHLAARITSKAFVAAYSPAHTH